MVTYVVTRDERELNEYRERHRLEPVQVRLVKSVTDLAAADVKSDRFVFYGRCYELADIEAILDFCIGERAPVEMSSRLPSRACRKKHYRN